MNGLEDAVRLAACLLVKLDSQNFNTPWHTAGFACRAVQPHAGRVPETRLGQGEGGEEAAVVIERGEEAVVVIERGEEAVVVIERGEEAVVVIERGEEAVVVIGQRACRWGSGPGARINRIVLVSGLHGCLAGLGPEFDCWPSHPSL
jgi:hypothetical protein